MVAQPTLFDPVEGRRRRDLGMARVDALVEHGWRTRFDRSVRMFAAVGEDFTADDIIEQVGMPLGNPNAIGARMNALARAGVIVATGRTAKAKRPESHARRQTVWRGAT